MSNPQNCRIQLVALLESNGLSPLNTLLRTLRTLLYKVLQEQQTEQF